mmetsp:Transcript_121560/g.171058  ORF Transcript_121560/g.171058 Transcript_121560/m.171058 type:complete len:220 (+) Transcript_121560:137-796(+)
MAKPTTRSARKGRSKSPAPRASPAKTRSRTRSTKKAAPKSPSKEKSTPVKSLKLDESSKVSKTKDTTSKSKSVPQTEINFNVFKGVSDVLTKFEFTTLTACRLHYAQLFLIGMFALVAPHLVATTVEWKVGGKAFELAFQWFGATLISYSMQLMAAAQGTHDEQKKSLQYGMFLWILLTAVVIFQNEQLKHREYSVYWTGYALANLSLSIWSCYFVKAK